MTPDERRKLVESILFEAQKARSNILEAIGHDDGGHKMLADLNPGLSEANPLNLIDICMRMLAGGREVEPGDLYNVLYLAHKEPAVVIGFTFREIELPQPIDALRS